MSRDAATPISKYLASIDRRHSLLTSGVLPSTPTTNSNVASISKNFNFNSDSFLSDDQSMLHIPSPVSKENRTNNVSIISASSINSSFDLGISDRKRRKSFYGGDDNEKLRKKADDLERLLRQTQIDLIDSRSIISKLEHQKISAGAQNKEKIIANEQSSRETNSQLKTVLEKVKDLEEKIEKLEKKEEEAVNSLHQHKTAHSNLVCSLQNRIFKLQSENCDIKQKYDEEVQKNSEVVRKLSNDLEGTERGAEKWVIESQSLKDQLTLVQKQLLDCQNKLKDSETRLIKFDETKSKYEELLNDVSNNKANDDNLTKLENLYVNEQIKNKKLSLEIAKLQEHNTTMRSTMSSEMLLNEKIVSLEARVQYMTKELKEKVACDEDRKALQHEVKQWKTVAFKLNTRCTTPVNFESFLRQNQNQILEMNHDINNLKLELKNKIDHIAKLQGENVTLKEQVKVLKEQSEKSHEELKKTSKRLLLIAKDRDSLRGLKESYEQEFEGHCSKALQERNLQLETLIEQYETLINEDPSFAKRPCENCEELKLKVLSLSSDLDRTKQDLEQKSITLAANQTQLGHLENVDSDLSYRIISFGKNPSMMSIEEKLKEVLNENERLKLKIQTLTDDSRVEPLNATVMEEKRGLEDKLKALERKHEILTDSYEYETSQLQTAIERLFGYHIILAREPQSQIRLQSVNSPNPDDVFIFQAAESNDWMLLETPVLELFRQEIENYLLTAGNIPGFLAMVTIRYSQGFPDSGSADPNTTVIENIPVRQQQNPAQQQQGSRPHGVRQGSEPSHGSSDDEDHDDQDHEEDYDEVDEEEEEAEGNNNRHQDRRRRRYEDEEDEEEDEPNSKEEGDEGSDRDNSDEPEYSYGEDEDSEEENRENRQVQERERPPPRDDYGNNDEDDDDDIIMLD